MMMLADIIYCDSERIEDYLEQIRSRKISNKILSWVSEIQLGFAKLSPNNYLKISELSEYEKSLRLIKYLNNKENLGIDRPNKQGEGTPDFYFESCTATRMYFESSKFPDSGFSLWISEYKDKENLATSGRLYLLENFDREDRTYLKRISSPYSLLWALENNKFSEEAFSSLEAKDLANRPVSSLEQRGFISSPPKKITVLYKIRQLFPEFYDNSSHQLTVLEQLTTPDRLTTIGYPLVIFDNYLTIEDLLR